MKNKRGLSAVVVTVLLIAMALGLITIIWTVVNGIIEQQTSSASSCFSIMDKVTINERYTCNTTGPATIKFALSVGDIDLDAIIVSLEWETQSRTYEIDGFNSHPELGAGAIDLPGKNSGKTYFATNPNFDTAPDVIKISPVINGNNCGISDSALDISSCL